jgi:molecular chaperone GrpE
MSQDTGKFTDDQAAPQAEQTAASEAPQTATDTASPEADPAAEWKSKVAYLAAEIDNMRKRYTRERADLMKFANEELIRAVLPVVDNLHLAVKAVKDGEAKVEPLLKEHPLLASLVKGVDMTLTHFEQTLERAGVKQVEAQGKPFNPVEHEAVGQSSTPDVGDNHVSSVMQRGYTLHGRVIRPARVVVNKATN